MGMGGGDSSAANESNNLIKEQINIQEKEQEDKKQSLFSDELVALKSSGTMSFNEPKSNDTIPGGL